MFLVRQENTKNQFFIFCIVIGASACQYKQKLQTQVTTFCCQDTLPCKVVLSKFEQIAINEILLQDTNNTKYIFNQFTGANQLYLPEKQNYSIFVDNEKDKTFFCPSGGIITIGVYNKK